jgi:Niemann-Pick C1 protein
MDNPTRLMIFLHFLVYFMVCNISNSDSQPPCCQHDQDSSSCSASGACNNCTTCFLRSDLHNGRPSTTQFKEKLPWFLDALPSSDCSKGGKGAYSTSLDLNGYENGIIQASAFRTYHTPLNKQVMHLNEMQPAISSLLSNSNIVKCK